MWFSSHHDLGSNKWFSSGTNMRNKYEEQIYGTNMRNKYMEQICGTNMDTDSSGADEIMNILFRCRSLQEPAIG